jgi:predicted pyridoxine 5'-phosphate oxidase superfamily flavin-nucleotide-binding protein
MAESFSPGALLGHVYQLEDGTAVRLRLARGSDVLALRELLARDSRDLSAARLLQFDPRREYVLCATALLDGQEKLLGLGAIKRDGTEPHLVVINDGAGEQVRRLLIDSLVGTARTISRSRAA